MKKRNWKNHIEFQIEDLHLDTQNPRTDTGAKLTEKEVMKELLKEDILLLAKDISRNGFLAASTLMIVKNTAVDGNRRLLAVKILQNPGIVKDLVPTKELKQIQELSKNRQEVLSSLVGVSYPNRKEADKEMAKMHLSGTAVKQWKLIRQCRYFQKRLTDEKDLSINTLAEILGIDKTRVKKNVKIFQLYEIAKKKIPDFKNNKGESIYNDDIFLPDKFQRLLVHEEGERLLGYSFSDETQKIEVENEKKFLLGLKLLLEEIYGKKLNAQFSSTQRLDIYKTIQPDFLNTKDYRKELQHSQEQQTNGQTPMFGTPTVDRAIVEEKIIERSDKKSSGLFSPSQVPFKLGNKQLQKLYDELKDPNILEFPNAAHDLLRSFLECSLVAYLKHDKINRYKEVLGVKNQKNLTLRNLLDYVADDKKSPIQERSVRLIAKQLISDDRKEYSVVRMDMVNHNENWFSVEQDVRNAWEKIEPLFKIILNPNKHVLK